MAQTAIDGVIVEITQEKHDEIHYMSSDQKSHLVRLKRDDILTTVVDPLVSNPLRWADLTSDKQAEWSQYRTDLLGVPQQAGFPNNITWPTQPS